MTLLELAKKGSMEDFVHAAEYETQDLKQRDASGNTVLHYAVRAGSLPKVRYTAEYLNLSGLEANWEGVTPLDEALAEGQKEIADFLAEKAGVDVSRLFHNPVRRGFYPDPSWIRVGDAFYMVNSSFHFFPCIPISRSYDLVHWTTVGYAITNPDWARVDRSEGGRGYWAPDISYDPASRRYFITATYRGNADDAKPRLQMVTSSDRPEGPYDEPSWIHIDGIDPSIFHDEDGRHYMLFNRSVRMVELAADCRKTAGKPWLLWGGDWKVKTEGPQLTRHADYYYLLAAEGGTGSGHRISAARSRSIWGPYETCPYNPILREPDPDGYLQNCGHGKLLELADGRWYLCHLCLRSGGGQRSPMGRETAIEEVVWTPDGWPVVKNGRHPAAEMKIPIRPAAKMPEGMENCQIPAAPAEAAGTDDRKRQTPGASSAPAGIVRWNGQEWLTVRRLDPENLALRNGTLHLTGNGKDLHDLGMQGILVVRQQEREFQAETSLYPASFAAACEGDSAGMTCYYDEHSYLKFGVMRTAGGFTLCLQEYAGDQYVREENFPIPEQEKVGRSEEGKTDLSEGQEKSTTAAAGDGCSGEEQTLRLQIRAEHGQRIFAAVFKGSAPITLCTIPEPAYLASEGLKCGKRFTGATVGVYVQGRFTAAFADWKIDFYTKQLRNED